MAGGFKTANGPDPAQMGSFYSARCERSSPAISALRFPQHEMHRRQKLPAAPRVRWLLAQEAARQDRLSAEALQRLYRSVRAAMRPERIWEKLATSSEE
jgi:hypothetical protein